MDEPERERWRGKIDEALKNIESDVTILFRKSEEQVKDHNSLDKKVTEWIGNVKMLGMKIGVYAGVAAAISGAIVQYILYLLKH